jgi:hypothetical protein
MSSGSGLYTEVHNKKAQRRQRRRTFQYAEADFEPNTVSV